MKKVNPHKANRIKRREVYLTMAVMRTMSTITHRGQKKQRRRAMIVETQSLSYQVT